MSFSFDENIKNLRSELDTSSQSTSDRSNLDLSRVPTIGDVVAERTPTYDRRTIIQGLQQAEMNLDNSFKRVSEMILMLMIRMHDWSTLRRRFQMDQVDQEMMRQVNDVIATEEEQERKRLRMAQFVGLMKQALSALAGEQG